MRTWFKDDSLSTYFSESKFSECIFKKRYTLGNGRNKEKNFLETVATW